MWSRTSLLLIAVVSLHGCSQNKPGGSTVISSAAGYNKTVDELEKAQLPVMEKYYGGEKLLPEDVVVLESCLEKWLALIAFAPTQPANHFGAGETCFVLQDYSNAIRHLQNVVNYTGKTATMEYKDMRTRAFGIVSASSFFIGRYDQAVTAAQEAQKLDPENPEYALLESQAVIQVDRKMGIALLKGHLKKFPKNPPLQRLLDFQTKTEKKN